MIENWFELLGREFNAQSKPSYTRVEIEIATNELTINELYWENI